MGTHKQKAERLTDKPLPLVVRILGKAVYLITTIGMVISATGVLIALALIGYSVVTRYLVGQPSLWVDDVIGFILIAIVMFGASSVLRDGKHLGVDLFTGRLQRTGQRWAQAWAMLTVMGVAAFLIVDGWQVAMFSKMLGMRTHGYVEFPIYWMQLLMPLGGVMLVLVALESLARLICGASAYNEPSDEETN